MKNVSHLQYLDFLQMLVRYNIQNKSLWKFVTFHRDFIIHYALFSSFKRCSTVAKFSLYSTSFLRSSATIFSGAFSTKPLFDNFFCTNVTSFCHFSFSFSKRATSFSKSI